MPQFFGAKRLFTFGGQGHRTPAQTPEPAKGAALAVAAGLGFVMVGAVVALGIDLALKTDAGQAARLTAARESALPRMQPLVAPPAPGAIALAAEDLPMPRNPLADAVAAALAAETVTSSAGAPPQTDCIDRLDALVTPLFIQFEPGSTDISSRHAEPLMQVSQQIIACKQAHIMVAGHADSTGDDQLNMALSWERADRALDRLVALGVDPDRLEAVGFGARAPLSEGSNDSDSIDRRVEFRVLRRPESR